MTVVSVMHDTFSLEAAGVVLDADVAVPDSARGVVLFAHGSGSSRHSRNRSVAGELQRAGVAAAERPGIIAAIVSRGGRPDLAADSLGNVRQPTLLIVGERDEVVIGLNRRAMERLAGESYLEIIAGATHLFEEPGALEHVAQLARE